MKKVAVYILATDKNLHRLRVMCAGGIRAKKNDLKIIMMGEGKKPDFLNKNMKWLDWNKYRVTDKHILAVNKGILIDADYHVFCDDDCFIDVDNMVESLEKQNIKDYPCYWSQPGMGSYIKDIPVIMDFFKNCITEKCDLDNLKSSWIGWCWTVVNKKFADISKKSKQSKLVLDFSYTLNHFIPDYQICVLGALIKAKHFYQNPAPAGTQWKDYFDYSGIVKNAPLWLIHYAVDNNILEIEDLIKTVKKEPQKIDDAIYSMFSSQFTKGVKPKHFVNKNIIKKYFFIYWGYHAWHHPVIDEGFKNVMSPRRDGRIIIKDSAKEWKWSENKKGILFHDEFGNPISEIRWITKNGLIGKNIQHRGKVLDLFEFC